MRPIALITLVCLLAGCATTSSRFTIEKQLRNIGVDNARASCIADEMADRLSSRQLSDFADFLRSVDRQDSPGQALDALGRMRNPDIGRAIAASGLACVITR